MSRALGFAVAATFWLTLFRICLGLGCAVDGASKLGWIPPAPSATAADDLQPSPLGPVSAVIEIIAGLFVFIGLRTRTACLVLTAHYALGLLVLKLRDPAALAQRHVTCWDFMLMVILLAIGPGALSVDNFWPDLLPRLFRRRKATS